MVAVDGVGELGLGTERGVEEARRLGDANCHPIQGRSDDGDSQGIEEEEEECSEGEAKTSDCCAPRPFHFHTTSGRGKTGTRRRGWVVSMSMTSP